MTAPHVRYRLRKVLRYVEHVLATMGMLFLLCHIFLQVGPIVSSSMSPALNGPEKGPQDWTVAERLSTWLRQPRRWEIVSFYNTEGLMVAKRVVALPGEEVSIVDGLVCINGRPLAPPPNLSYLKYVAAGRVRPGHSVQCAIDEFFVLGDETLDSYDSRYEGPIRRQQILSRTVLRIWPRDRIAWLVP